MFAITILFLTILIPSIQSTKPSLKLTFVPDSKYYTLGHPVDIICETLNPTEGMETAQLWHIDLKTNKHTAISRSILSRPTDDAPEIFKNNKNKRLEFVKKNYLRIKTLQIDDSARYECNCPDCEDPPPKQDKMLQVMKHSDPKWHIEPGWPIQEGAKTTIKCTADDFYPYVGYRILRHHHDIASLGKAAPLNSDTYPQKFSWEATITPSFDWHNTTLHCTVLQGDTERHAVRNLDVIFTPRFLTCKDVQHVDSLQSNFTINCSYAGNPKPELTWFRQIDGKPLAPASGITIHTIDEHHGKYTSVVTFDRDKLANVPASTTQKSPTGSADSTAKPLPLGETYYQQLLNGGFIAKITYNNEEKEARKITIVADASQARSKVLENSSRKAMENVSTSMLLFLSLILFYMMTDH